MDDESISDTGRSLEKLERAVRATKVRYHWEDNIAPPKNSRTEASNTKKRASSISSDERYLDNRLAQIGTDEEEDEEDVFSPTPTRPRVLRRRLSKQRPGCSRSREISDADTTTWQPRGESAKKSLLHSGPEAAHAEKIKLYRSLMEALTPLLGLDTGGRTDEELVLLRQLTDMLTAEGTRLNEIKKKQEREEATERKTGIFKQRSGSAAR